jgi:hypothetical protein
LQFSSPKIFVVDLDALLETIVRDVDDECVFPKKPKNVVDVNYKFQ